MAGGLLRGDGKAASRPIKANPRGTLAVEGLDGATTFSRDAAGFISMVKTTDEFGGTWLKRIDRDTSSRIVAVAAWSLSTSSTVTSITTMTTISSSSTGSTTTTAST